MALENIELTVHCTRS